MKPSYIDIKDFDYLLPEDKIAKYPLEQRSLSKLLYYHQGKIGHEKFTNLPELLPEKCMLVFNNTRVIEARLNFKKVTGADIEVFLLNPAHHENATSVLEAKGESIWECMIGNKKRWKEGDVLIMKGKGSSLTARWKDRENDIVQFEYSGDQSLQEVIQGSGSLPIPPYLNRSTETIDLTRYQTIFAQLKGSVAAPTAALHFDEHMYKKLAQKGIKCEYLTLHVGAGTFKPVSTDNAIDHIMHKEYMIFSKEFIQRLVEHEGPLIAVGTTSLRSLESLYWFGVGLKKGVLQRFHIDQYFPYENESEITYQESLMIVLGWIEKNQVGFLEGTSSIYIVPGYQLKGLHGIITNFHQPQSTLLLLIAALVGEDWKRIYNEALENNYRFLSYGDSSLLLF